jgi:hypothetical protein
MNAHTDMSSVIIPRSDQYNADDLVAGPITVRIREVKITQGSEQPVSILIEDSEKVFRPCKSSSRVLVMGWGPDASKYVGRSLTLYRDADVKWGGLAVGGIRISHMSDLDGPKTMMLTATKGSRKPHKVLPLTVSTQTSAPPTDPAEKFANAYAAKLATLTTMPDLDAFVMEKKVKLDELQAKHPELYDQVSAAIADRVVELAPADGFDAELEAAE